MFNSCQFIGNFLISLNKIAYVEIVIVSCISMHGVMCIIMCIMMYCVMCIIIYGVMCIILVWYVLLCMV